MRGFVSARGVSSVFFFLQAEGGMRDLTVTGVQTCALPIFPPASPHAPGASVRNCHRDSALPRAREPRDCPPHSTSRNAIDPLPPTREAAQQWRFGSLLPQAKNPSASVPRMEARLALALPNPGLFLSY